MRGGGDVFPLDDRLRKGGGEAFRLRVGVDRHIADIVRVDERSDQQKWLILLGLQEADALGGQLVPFIAGDVLEADAFGGHGLGPMRFTAEGGAVAAGAENVSQGGGQDGSG